MRSRDPLERRQFFDVGTDGGPSFRDFVAHLKVHPEFGPCAEDAAKPDWCFHYPGLLATDDQLASIEVDGLGFNLHWPALDADLYVPALVSGIFGTRAWMTRELARRAGQATSPAKAAAARTNGAHQRREGGRPRKVAQA